MSGPQRAPDQTGISVSMSKSLLADIDARAKKLNITRSQYFALIARNDLIDGGDLTLRETTTAEQKAANDKAAAAVVISSYSKPKGAKR